jgi:hypothetical protein
MGSDWIWAMDSGWYCWRDERWFGTAGVEVELLWVIILALYISH